MMHENEGYECKIEMPRVEGETMGMPKQPNIPSPHQDSRAEGAPKKKVAPEKKVMRFAIKMVIVDLVAILLGMLESYLVVRKTNMGVMIKSVIVLTLVLEGIRILCRSRGLELYMYNMKQLPHSICIISRLFYCLHLISVLISGVLSMVQLASRDFGKTDALLVFFYVVAVLEAMVFLAAMAIWIRKVSHGRLFETVQDECGLGNLNLDMDPIRRFFYDVYYKCVTGHILDVLKMDLVTFAEERLDSTSSEKQFMGARILEELLTHEESEATLCKILTSNDSKVIKRLIQISNLKSIFNEDVRRSAAKIVSKLAEKEPNVKQHVAGMKEAIESAKELLLHPSNFENV